MSNDMRRSLPEPLQAFDAVKISDLSLVEELHQRFVSLHEAGRVPANSVEAMRVELTYHSNAIEGNTLTLRETQLVIEGRSPTGGKSLREVYEARNHDRALRMIERWVQERPASSPVMEDDLLHVHGAVMADIDDRNAGRFRDERVLIAGTRFVPPGSQKFGELIPALLNLANQANLQPLVKAAELHYNLVAVHPFVDGNGRTARLMMNHHLLRRGWPLVVIEVEQRKAYLDALDAANRGELEPLANIVVQGAARTLQRLLGED